jgi:hypothetical protein
MIRHASSLLIVGWVGPSCCWAAPNTELVVPSVGDVTGLQALAQKVGAQADVITIAGDRVRLEVTAGGANVLHGTRLDGDAGEVVLPLDSVALAYYTEPSADGREVQAVSKKNQYPLLLNVGEVEQGLDCTQIDSELARAEAVRWYLRSEGVMSSAPIREQEPAQHRATPKEVTANVAAVVGCTLILAGCNAVPARKSPEVHAVESADQRIAGLLRLKVDKVCAGRPTLRPGAMDLDVWSSLGNANANSSDALLVMETAALDLLSPKPLATPTSEVVWVPGLDHPRVRRDIADLAYWTGSAQLADHGLVINLREHGRKGQLSVNESVVHIPYTAIASAEWSSASGSEPVVILWQVDGRYDAMQVAPVEGAKRTDRLAELRLLHAAIQLKVAAERLATVGEPPALATTYENAGVIRENSLERVVLRSVVALTERDIVFSGPTRIYHVPYPQLASAELNDGGRQVILRQNVGPAIRVQLYERGSSARLDRERMKALVADLHSRMADGAR